MDGGKFPIWAIAKGLTNRFIQSQFGFMAQDPDVIFTQSPSGWVNQEIMNQYLRWSSQIYSGLPLSLIMDSYACNYCENILDLASELMIEIIIIPPGGTSLYQPLDIAIFGIVKTRAKAIFRELYVYNPSLDLNKATGCYILKTAWKKLTEHHVLKGWERYFPDDIRYLLNY